MNAPRPTFREIQVAVAAYYKLLPEDIISRCNARQVAWPRQMALYLSRTLTRQSFPRIGLYYQRDHSTVIYAVEQVSYRIKADRKTCAAHHRIKRRLKDIAARRHAHCSQEMAA